MLENEKQFKTAMIAYLSSSEVGTGDLRAYARIIGVKRPTTKKNNELIEEITAILLGELEPIEISHKGAPVKNDFVKPTVLDAINRLCKDYHIFDKYEKKQAKDDNILPSLFPKVYDPTKLVLHDSSLESIESVVFNGQLTYFNNVYYLFPVDCRNGMKILVPDRLVESYALREGDVVTCHVVRGEKMLVATSVVTVNGLVVNSFSRTNFDEALPCYPVDDIEFAEENSSLAIKYFRWVTPIKKGQRACIIAPPKAGKSHLLYELAFAMQQKDEKAPIFVLLVDQSPEAVGKFRRVFKEGRLVYTTYEDDAEQQVFAAEFLLKRVKRYVEKGDNVVLFVDSLTALAKAYNDTDASIGGKTLIGGMESKSLQYVKRFLGAARNMETGGSLTIIGTAETNTGNPVDELICAELTGVANLEIRLSGELASKRIYPAIDALKTKAGEGILATKEDELLRTNYLPKYGNEAFLSLLEKTNTKENLLELLKK
ncbi:MAG: hypothetical protein E7355_00195 [Clostridiales bacterium]|nr:hypothetical protein [Clostridiales bacterium]